MVESTFLFVLVFNSSFRIRKIFLLEILVLDKVFKADVETKNMRATKAINNFKIIFRFFLSHRSFVENSLWKKWNLAQSSFLTNPTSASFLFFFLQKSLILPDLIINMISMTPRSAFFSFHFYYQYIIVVFFSFPSLLFSPPFLFHPLCIPYMLTLPPLIFPYTLSFSSLPLLSYFPNYCNRCHWFAEKKGVLLGEDTKDRHNNSMVNISRFSTHLFYSGLCRSL